MKFYDREGKEFSDILEWGRKRKDGEYHRIDQTTLPDGTWISTVWLGIDHSFGSAAPLIFETMVFKNGESVDCRRYSTEEDARRGHVEIVNELLRSTDEKLLQ